MLSTVVTEVSTLFTSLFDLVYNILKPGTGGLTPLQAVAWFGFLAPLIGGMVAFIKSLAR